MSFVTVLFAPVCKVLKNIETNYRLVIETKLQGENISLTTSVWGEGTVGENNTNHVIKYFPQKTTGIGRGSGQVRRRWGGGGEGG